MEEQTLTAEPEQTTILAVAPSAPVETTQPVEPTAETGAPAEAEKTSTPESTTSEKKEWDGNLESLKDLGKDEIERAKSMRRYLTKKTQEISDIQRKAAEFEKLKTDPRYQLFMNGVQTNALPPPPVQQPQPLWSASEWQEAQVNPEKMAELFDRGVQARVREVAQQVLPTIEQIQQKQAFAESSQQISDFAQVHPDIWDLYDAGIMKPLVREIVDSGQGTIADAYEKARSIQSFFDQRATQKAQGRILEKKAAVTSAPSPTNEPSIIWADDREHATRLAFENALSGKKVNVKVRR